jgi:hypothetical protein
MIYPSIGKHSGRIDICTDSKIFTAIPDGAKERDQLLQVSPHLNVVSMPSVELIEAGQ